MSYSTDSCYLDLSSVPWQITVRNMIEQSSEICQNHCRQMSRLFCANTFPRGDDFKETQRPHSLIWKVITKTKTFSHFSQSGFNQRESMSITVFGTKPPYAGQPARLTIVADCQIRYKNTNSEIVTLSTQVGRADATRLGPRSPVRHWLHRRLSHREQHKGKEADWREIVGTAGDYPRQSANPR